MPHPRSFRFSLRALLALVAVCALPAAWIARRASEQRQAAAVVRQLGGYVLYDYEAAGSSQPEGWLPGWVGPEYHARIVRVYLTGRDVSDAALPPLYALHDLREVVLEATSVTDDGAAQLQRALPECVIRR